MKFVIDNKNADIGVYDLYLENDDGKIVSGTEVTLWDYSHIEMENIPNQWKQRWTWCSGWSHAEEHTWEENLSTDDVISEIKKWITDMLTTRYNNALEAAFQLQPIIEFLKSDKDCTIS